MRGPAVNAHAVLVMLMALTGLAIELAASAESEVPSYAPVVSGYPLRFPADEGSHPGFRTEWWYLTGWLNAADSGGKPLGFQITFFRSRPRSNRDNPSAFAPRQLLFAHAALSDPGQQQSQHDERAARAGLSLAEAREDHTEVWIDDWSLRGSGQGYRAEIPAHDFQLSLQFEKTQPILIQGAGGVSRKGPSAGQASYYYSVPQLRVTGTITRNGKAEVVDGSAWLDHEWSSSLLGDDAVGWDWTALNLNDGGAFMAFRIRGADGSAVWAGGSYRSPAPAPAGIGSGEIDPTHSQQASPPSPGKDRSAGETRESEAGETRVFRRDEIRFTPLRTWRSARSATEYPVVMRVQAGELDLTLVPLFDDQEFDASNSTGTIYWEGAVRAFKGSEPIGGGYLELTGYWRRLEL